MVFWWPCGVSRGRLRRLGMYLGRLVWSREDALDGLWRLGEAWTRHGGSGWRLVRDFGSFVGGLRAFGGRLGASWGVEESPWRRLRRTWAKTADKNAVKLHGILFWGRFGPYWWCFGESPGLVGAL